MSRAGSARAGNPLSAVLEPGVLLTRTAILTTGNSTFRDVSLIPETPVDAASVGGDPTVSARGHCCFSEEDASVTVDCARSDGERQLGERSREPMPGVYVSGKFVVAAANILDKGVADADYPY